MAGYPNITVPAGFVVRPAGRESRSSAAAWSEPTLIKLAYAFEQAANARRKPSFVEDVVA